MFLVCPQGVLGQGERVWHVWKVFNFCVVWGLFSTLISVHICIRKCLSYSQCITLEQFLDVPNVLPRCPGFMQKRLSMCQKSLTFVWFILIWLCNCMFHSQGTSLEPFIYIHSVFSRCPRLIQDIWVSFEWSFPDHTFVWSGNFLAC